MGEFQIAEGTRVARATLRTADLRRALAFYQEALGLSPTEAGGGGVGLSAAPGKPPLVVLHEDPKAGLRPPRSTGLYHFAIRYPARSDLAAALRRLLSVQHPIQGASHHRVSEALYLSDPDGNGIELYADLPHSQWVWRDGQVEMATDPLDLDDLLAATPGDRTRAGPPPETDLGHLHLQVADLGNAERFYREFLGFSVTQRSYPGALFLAAGRYHHHLAVNTWSRPAAPPPNSVGLESYRLEVPSAEYLSLLPKRAARFGYELAGATGGALGIRDPNGDRLELALGGPPDSPRST